MIKVDYDKIIVRVISHELFWQIIFQHLQHTEQVCDLCMGTKSTKAAKM
jgi:hypothetical protein